MLIALLQPPAYPDANSHSETETRLLLRLLQGLNLPRRSPSGRYCGANEEMVHFPNEKLKKNYIEFIHQAAQHFLEPYLALPSLTQPFAATMLFIKTLASAVEGRSVLELCLSRANLAELNVGCLLSLKRPAEISFSSSTGNRP